MKTKCLPFVLVVFLIILTCGCADKTSVDEPESAVKNAQTESIDISDFTVETENKSLEDLPESQEQNKELNISTETTNVTENFDNTDKDDSKDTKNKNKAPVDKFNAVTVTVQNGKLGEEIIGVLSVEGIVDMCAVDAKFFYDTSKLKLKALESDNADVIMHKKSAEGEININFMRIKNVTEPFELCSFTFEVITSDTTESSVSVDVKEVVKLDGDDIVDCPYTTVNGTAYLN